MIFVWWGSEWGKWACVKATKKNLTIAFFLMGWAVIKAVECLDPTFVPQFLQYF